MGSWSRSAHWLVIALVLAGSAAAPPASAAEKPASTPYEAQDYGPFPPAGAIYFMDGTSQATAKVYSTGQQMTFRFADPGTSIAASAPQLYSKPLEREGAFVPVPPPLKAIARYPLETPDVYRREAVLELLQVVSMDLKDSSTGSTMLVGLPYAEKYPQLFLEPKLFPDGAASYGIIASMEDGLRSEQMLAKKGYPARSFFGIYHVLETPMGTFFNRKAMQMELQPDSAGKLALTHPPIPFRYELANGPIPLFDVKNPDGPAVAEIVTAHYESSRPSRGLAADSWLARPRQK